MQRVLSGLEEQELRNRVRHMDASETAVMCEEIPTVALLNEISRRCTLHEQQIAECKGVLKM